MKSGNEAGESSGINSEEVARRFVEEVIRRFEDNPVKHDYFRYALVDFKETGDLDGFRARMGEILQGHPDLLWDFYSNFNLREVTPEEQQPVNKEKQD